MSHTIQFGVESDTLVNRGAKHSTYRIGGAFIQDITRRRRLCWRCLRCHSIVGADDDGMGLRDNSACVASAMGATLSIYMRSQQSLLTRTVARTACVGTQAENWGCGCQSAHVTSRCHFHSMECRCHRWPSP